MIAFKELELSERMVPQMSNWKVATVVQVIGSGTSLKLNLRIYSENVAIDDNYSDAPEEIITYSASEFVDVRAAEQCDEEERSPLTVVPGIELIPTSYMQTDSKRFIIQSQPENGSVQLGILSDDDKVIHTEVVGEATILSDPTLKFVQPAEKDWIVVNQMGHELHGEQGVFCSVFKRDVNLALVQLKNRTFAKPPLEFVCKIKAPKTIKKKRQKREKRKDKKRRRLEAMAKSR